MNILLLVLLRAWSFVVNKVRAMSNKRYQTTSFRTSEFLYLAASLLGSAMVGTWIINKMDPTGMNEVKRRTAKKTKEVEARLGATLRGVTQHEMMAVELVVSPSSIDVTVADIGGLDDILNRLLMSLQGPVTCPGVFGGGLLKTPKGILLYGPPGTGKTMMAKAIAKHVNAFFLAVQPSSVQNKYYGETNKAISGIFKLAKRLSAVQDSACIIFVDEVDALLGKRKDIEHEVSISMKTEFMSLWDGLETDAASRVVILGATNRPQELDQAVLRRFTLAVEVKLPDAAAREEIILTHLRQHCRDHPLGQEAVDEQLIQNETVSQLEGKRAVQWIAERTDGFSGADLHELAAEAARHSVVSVTSALDALRQGKQTVSTQPIEQPPLRLSDFQAALQEYQPTQAKAESFQAPGSDSLNAMARMLAASLVQADASQGNNGSSSRRNDISNGDGHHDEDNDSNDSGDNSNNHV